jgi:beta-lactam-binding protein with PASTA domain
MIRQQVPPLILAMSRSRSDYEGMTTATMRRRGRRVPSRAVAIAVLALIVAVAALITALGNHGGSTAPTSPAIGNPGNAAVLAPDLLGLTVRSATSTATSFGLVVTVVTDKSSTVPPGLVMAERGAVPGEKLHKGDVITLVVSAGPS